MENAKPVISEPEISPIEGIIAIRKIVGQWLRPEGSKPRDAIASVANVLLAVSVPVLTVPLTESQVIAKSLIDSLQEAEDFTHKAIMADPPRTFSGISSASKVDIITHLEKMIEQACHKPGEWKEGNCAGGTIDGKTFTESYDLHIGSLLQRRDAFLAIDAVNALPELIKRIRDGDEQLAAAKVDIVKLQDAAKPIPAATDSGGWMSQAWSDVVIERNRQMNEEGYNKDRDDCYTCGELAEAAATYALLGTAGNMVSADKAASIFPWDPEHLKPSSARKNMVKAAALLLAEIERIDRKGEMAAGIL